MKRSTSHLRGQKIDKCPACIYLVFVPKEERKNVPPEFSHMCKNEKSIYYNTAKTVKDKCNKLTRKEGEK